VKPPPVGTGTGDLNAAALIKAALPFMLASSPQEGEEGSTSGGMGAGGPPPPALTETVEFNAAAMLKKALPFMQGPSPEDHEQHGSAARLDGATKGGKSA
jgi:hypothetical protein